MIKRIPYLFLKSFDHQLQFSLFKKVLYIFLFVNTLTMLPMIDSVFGQKGIAGSMGFMWNGTSSFLNLLYHPAAYNRPYIPWFFVGGQLLFLSLGYFKILPRLSAIAIYFFTANLLFKGAIFFTGGEVLVCILLFYMIFMTEKKQLSISENIVNNTVFVALLVQVCILYFFSTFFKLFDENWINGKALSYVSEISYYTTSWFRDTTRFSSGLSAALTYSVLIYQALFPILVWFKKIKIPFLFYGVILHLGIAFGMGIFSFGIIMIICYLLFLDARHIKKLNSLFRRDKNG